MSITIQQVMLDGENSSLRKITARAVICRYKAAPPQAKWQPPRKLVAWGGEVQHSSEWRVFGALPQTMFGVFERITTTPADTGGTIVPEGSRASVPDAARRKGRATRDASHRVCAAPDVQTFRHADFQPEEIFGSAGSLVQAKTFAENALKLCCRVRGAEPAQCPRRGRPEVISREKQRDNSCLTQSCFASRRHQ